MTASFGPETLEQVSVLEVETQLHIAQRLSFVTAEQVVDIAKLWKEAIAMLNVLMNALPRQK